MTSAAEPVDGRIGISVRVYRAGRHVEVDLTECDAEEVRTWVETQKRYDSGLAQEAVYALVCKVRDLAGMTKPPLVEVLADE